MGNPFGELLFSIFAWVCIIIEIFLYRKQMFRPLYDSTHIPKYPLDISKDVEKIIPNFDANHIITEVAKKVPGLVNCKEGNSVVENTAVAKGYITGCQEFSDSYVLTLGFEISYHKYFTNMEYASPEVKFNRIHDIFYVYITYHPMSYDWDIDGSSSQWDVRREGLLSCGKVRPDYIKTDGKLSLTSITPMWVISSLVLLPLAITGYVYPIVLIILGSIFVFAPALAGFINLFKHPMSGVVDNDIVHTYHRVDDKTHRRYTIEEHTYWIHYVYKGYVYRTKYVTRKGYLHEGDHIKVKKTWWFTSIF